jgi:transposase, IS5 family
MSQAGFFDFEQRKDQLDAHGNPLRVLEDAIDFQAFRPTLMKVRDKQRKSNAGRPAYDVVLMFKMLVLQSLYNLSDNQIEYQVRDRISFMAFLGLDPGDDVPDEKTLWRFREQLTELGLVEVLFEQFDRDLSGSGFTASKGSIVDASIIPAPRQRNSRGDNETIKEGHVPASFAENPCKQRQKDTDARWTTKRGEHHFGYKNHINADVKHKFVRRFAVTDAATHDSQVIDQLLDENNRYKDVYADPAYRSRAISDRLKEQGYRDRIHYKATRGRALNEREKKANKKRSRIRVRVEHVFGRQVQKLGGKLIRCIGIARAKTAIGLRNLVYNLDHYARLVAD